MGWMLGFGIPIAYILLGLFTSRIAYRSRHKRDLNGSWDSDDTLLLCATMFFFWPILTPIYFPIVWWGETGTNMIKSFYNHNLPETHHEKQTRLEKEAREANFEKRKLANRINELERELKIGPYSKDVT